VGGGGAAAGVIEEEEEGVEEAEREEEEEREEAEEEEEERAKARGIRGEEATRAGSGDQVQVQVRARERREGDDARARAGEGASGEGTGDGEKGKKGKKDEVEIEAGEMAAAMQRGRVQRRMYGQAERRRQAEESMEVDEFRAVLHTWSVGCPWCRAMGEAEERCREHTLEGCREEYVGDIQEMVRRVKRVVRWEAYSCCFDCGLPQEICRRYEAKGPAGGFRRVQGQTCQYGGVLMQMVVSMWGAGGDSRSTQLYKWMRVQGANVDEGDRDGQIRWMGRKVRWGGMESNEMCRVALQLWRWQQEEEEEEREEERERERGRESKERGRGQGRRERGKKGQGRGM
jgi:hypothetical protein